MRRPFIPTLLACCCGVPLAAAGQSAPPTSQPTSPQSTTSQPTSPQSTTSQSTSSQPVTRQEFDQLRQENADVKQALADLKKQQADQTTSADQDAADADKRMKDLADQVDRSRPGLEGFILAGDAAIGFQTQRNTHSTFFADVSPLILWQPPEKRLLVETAFDLGIGGSDVTNQNSNFAVNLADLSYVVTDNLTIGGGLFEVPFGQFHNHFDPPWINKFPDNPLAFDAIAPVSEVGFFAKGAFPSGTTRWTYDVYVANGPNLIVDDPAAAGTLNFNDYTDLNNNKAVGGRIGFLPFPDVEAGYSLQFSSPSPGGFQKVHAFMQAADFHYKPTLKMLYGQFDLSAEWIWANVGNATYDPAGAAGFGPSQFNNYRQGGYVSLGYRPTEAQNRYLRNVEFLARFDSLQSALNSPGGEHESRVTLGVDYWVTPYCVVKAAYELDQKRVGTNQNAFIFQVGYGL